MPISLQPSRVQRGMMLIEALIGILLFSIGILAMVALQASSIAATSDAKYRVEALNLANQILGEMSTGINRTSEASIQAGLMTFEHMAGNASSTCDFEDGTASANAKVTAWSDVVAGALPNAQQQIDVNVGASNQVTVTICWRPPSDLAAADARRYVVVTNIN